MNILKTLMLSVVVTGMVGCTDNSKQILVKLLPEYGGDKVPVTLSSSQKYVIGDTINIETILFEVKNKNSGKNDLVYLDHFEKGDKYKGSKNLFHNRTSVTEGTIIESTKGIVIEK